MGGTSTRIGTYKCYQCRKPFTVKIGTILESSHVPLHMWLQAIFLMASSKKGVSSNQLHRTLGVTLKTAWFMSHRIREAMRSGGLVPLGGAGKVVEADETYIGRIRGMKKSRGPSHKMKVLSLVKRGGAVRSMMVESVSRPVIEKIVKKNVDRESRLMTDEAPYYPASAGTSLGTRRSTTAAKSGGEAKPTPTPSKACSASSSAGCAASTSTAARSVCIATLPSSISGRTPASGWA
jgi:ISXO2-like transposase domain